MQYTGHTTQAEISNYVMEGLGMSVWTVCLEPKNCHQVHANDFIQSLKYLHKPRESKCLVMMINFSLLSSGFPQILGAVSTIPRHQGFVAIVRDLMKERHEPIGWSPT